MDLSQPSKPEVVETIVLDDPTHARVKQGRIAFETASSSTTGTFSCASCHPNGHTDQLLWVLKTPIVTGGDQIMPRLTMPIRGLRETEPYHWDDTLGDPYGGINSAHLHTVVPPNSRVDAQESSACHLIDAGLAATMSQEGDSKRNDEKKPGRLSRADRDAMAQFLLAVPYPPAQRRSFDDARGSPSSLLPSAMARGDLDAVQRHIAHGAGVNEPDPKTGTVPLSDATLHDRLDMARYLIEHGADVSATNRDGNTPLHTAAFLGRTELMKLLIENGARLSQRNHRRESPADLVSGAWNAGLEQFYGFIAASADVNLDLGFIRQERPRLAQHLREQAAKPVQKLTPSQLDKPARP